ncbi:MAG: hypothetical protein AABW51_03245 [Nanoarchaeota archaeon]
MFVKRGNRLGNSRPDLEINKILPRSNRSQVTIFIIVAILIVASVVLFFVFKNNAAKQEPITVSVDPAYTTFLSCVEDQASNGIKVLESQGGYINPPEFEPGSRYMPFSNQLDFLGNPIPYWYYVSANNIQKEQVPSKSEMETQIAKFVEGKARDCDFSSYTAQGYEITQGDPKASVSIKNNEVDIDLSMDLAINKTGSSSFFKNHAIVVKSNLGELYNSALSVYNKEQSEMFLENYSIDNLRLYAPVDGVDLLCSPLTWNADKVFDDLQNGIQANTLAINVKNDNYFKPKFQNVPADVQVKFLNSRNWTYSFEVNPSDGPLMMASPVGNQPGFGILGFCYVPYHFVYDLRYPVLIQVQKGDEIFQFPVAIVILGNKPRQPLNGESANLVASDLCANSNTKTQFSVHDSSLKKIDAEIFYECLGARCDLGKTSNGALEKELPQCVNGIVIAKADGYKDSREIYTSVDEGQVQLIMNKVYQKNVDLRVDGKSYLGSAIIYFISGNDTKTVIYPEQKSVEVGEGQYEIQVYIYQNSSLKIDSNVTTQCVSVPRGGVLGIVGFTQKKCFDVEIPSQIISNALAGGGKQPYYILQGELENSQFIEINAGSLATPKTIDELQNNYILFDTKGLDVNFK